MTTAETSLSDQVLELQLGQLFPSPQNPRKRFDETSLAELAESIKAQGLLEPLLVRTPNSAGKHEIIAGDRRYRAAQLAGLRSVPCVVRELDDRQAVECMVVENLQRDDLSPMEEARAFQAYIETLSSSSEKGDGIRSVPAPAVLAKQIGKSEDYVRERCKLNSLEPEVQDAIEGGKLRLKVALMLTRVSEPHLRRQVLEKALAEDLTSADVRELLGKYFIDLNRAPFSIDQPAAKGLQDCMGCRFRLYRGGNVMLPNLLGKDRDIGVCSNTQCFRQKAVHHAETRLKATVFEGDFSALHAKYPEMHHLWLGDTWQKKCPGCAERLVMIQIENSRSGDVLQKICTSSAAHFGRHAGAASSSEAKERRKKGLRDQRRRAELERRQLEAASAWLYERLTRLEGQRFVIETLVGSLRSFSTKLAAELLGENPSNSSEAAAALKAGFQADYKRVYAVAAIVTRFALYGSVNGDLQNFLKKHAIQVPPAGKPLCAMFEGEA